MQTLREYYENADLKQSLSYSNPEWRLIRGMTFDGHFIQRGGMRDVEKLRAWILKFLFKHVWYSVGKYLSPRTVGFNDYTKQRAGFNKKDNLLLGGDLVFDIDYFHGGDHDRPMEKALIDALNLEDFLSKKGFETEWHFSGGGFHAIIEKHDLQITEEDPQKRLEEYKRLREPLVKEIKLKGIQIHEPVTLDCKRIIRALGTANMRTGYVCSKINRLDGFRLDGMERVQLPTSPEKPNVLGDDHVFPSSLHEESQCQPVWAMAEGTTPITLSSRIIPRRMKRQTLVLSFHKKTLWEVKQTIIRLLAHERLADFFIFQHGQDYYALSPTALNAEEIPNMLERNRLRQDKAQQVKFRRRLAYITKGVMSIPSPHTPITLTSKGHNRFLQWIGFPVTKSLHECGDGRVYIGHAR